MISTITDYSRPVDTEETVLEYHFDDTLKRSLADRVVFDEEDSNFAPEPSVACRIRDDHGVECTLIYLQSSKVLLVYGEAGVDRSLTAGHLVRAFPELHPHRLDLPFESNQSSGVAFRPQEPPDTHV